MSGYYTFGKWYFSFNEGRLYNDWVPELVFQVGYQNRKSTGVRRGVWLYASIWRFSGWVGFNYYPKEVRE